jgi:seryl-tRNA synthetase
MIDVNKLELDFDKIKTQINKRGADLSTTLISVVDLNKKRKELILEVENLKAQKNQTSKKIGELMRDKKNDEAAKLKASVTEINEAIEKGDAELEATITKLNQINAGIPNIPNDGIPVGADENDNVVVRDWKSGEIKKTEIPHWDIATKLGLVDFEYGAKISGSRFLTYTGEGARLVRYIADILLKEHRERGYKEFFLPVLVNREIMFGTGQLPKFEDDAYKVDDSFLVPTAEVPLTNMYRNEILDGKNLPINVTAFTQCFRRESGSAGRDTRGMIRLHQFNKVELVKFSNPKDSYNELEKMTNDAENILQLFKLPYRVVELCSGDLGFSAAKTYDLEVWFPNQEKYREISSCSNCLDFQARRINARFKDEDGTTKLVHTLNGSGVAIDRLIAAILENYYDGEKLVLPEVLKPYYGKDYLD